MTAAAAGASLLTRKSLGLRKMPTKCERGLPGLSSRPVWVNMYTCNQRCVRQSHFGAPSVSLSVTEN